MLFDFREELNSVSISLHDSRIIIAGTTAEEGERAMQTLLQNPHPPTAVFARTDTLAAGALRGALRLGARVPEDVSLIGHDDMSFASLLEPPLTTIRVDCLQLGEAAAALMLQILETPDPEIATSPKIVLTSLIMRETLIGPHPTEK